MTTPDRATLWAYAYRLLPPLDPAKLRQLKELMAREHSAAQQEEGKWEARFVTDERVAHILVLTDSPDLDRAANKRIEGELKRLEAGYSLTVPLAVNDGGADITPKE
jgi:hypothetical protein